MTTEKKITIMEEIELEIQDLQFDITNELHSEEEIADIKLDLDSLMVIYSRLKFLKTC